MVREIIQEGDPVLRKTAEDVPVSEIRGEKIQALIRDMNETLAEEENGVALAAPQVGVPKRIFVVHPKVFDESAEENLVFINPKILKLSRRLLERDEGCLSIRHTYGIVPRYEKVRVEAYDKEGKKFTRGASDLLAHIIQHEIDHLDGTLFTDKVVRYL